MSKWLLRDPRLFGMALMAPATLFIFGLHSWTTGRIFHYLQHYLYSAEGEIIRPMCTSLEYDVMYCVGFISFFLIMPLALAAQIGESVVCELCDTSETSSWLDQFTAQFRGSLFFLVGFIIIHWILMPILLNIPLGRPLWVEHNFARNVVFISPLLLVLGVLAQLIYCAIFQPPIARVRESPSLRLASKPSPAHRGFLFFVGVPLGGIAFWLTCAIFCLILIECSEFLFGDVSRSKHATLATVMTAAPLGIALASLVGCRLGIWRSPLRAILLITVVTVSSQIYDPSVFPIDWFKVCTIWSD